MEQDKNFTQLAAQIVASYVGHNVVKANELPALIQQTVAALASTASPEAFVQQEPQKPAVSIKKSVAQDHITCLEDGKQFKSLKRHIRTDHNLSPEEYRSKWGLPRNYPMVAPAYAEARSNLAREWALDKKAKPANVKRHSATSQLGEDGAAVPSAP